ncbi:unnamed protein product [Rotaria magnacalcarata]|uniref:L-Fucosyltransferase n=1 Tax=Rotaria magnacalcarata TaxID=392030 RepID=A0A816LIN9_9BILA|nr:unnamed protein product [Rotaria magnacalcarata]CAF4049313.1 unnamed protein product [Rotaria magnacalcarata]
MNTCNHLNVTSSELSLKRKVFYIVLTVVIVMLTFQFFDSSNQKFIQSQKIIYANLLKILKPTSVKNTTVKTSTTTTTTTSTTTTTTISTTTSLATLHITPLRNSSNVSIAVATPGSQTLSTTMATTTSFDEVLCDNITESKTINMPDNPCERIRCNILLRQSGGRLGNRMFMFASAYGLARTHNCRLFVAQPILNELSNNFQMKPIDKKMLLPAEEVNKLKDISNQLSICEFLPKMLIPHVFHTLEIFGYWQSYLYFDAYREEIREFFSSRNDTLSRLSAYLTNMIAGICPQCPSLPTTTHRELRQAFQNRYNVTWISIHIRRTDFRGLGYSSDDTYIRRAMNIYRRRYHNFDVRFLVASDDRPYCQQIFEGEIKARKVFVLPSTLSPGDDLMALTLCHHAIATGGTYGFWAAYLGGGEVIHDIRYKAGCSQMEYYPPWFMLIGPLPNRNDKASKT